LPFDAPNQFKMMEAHTKGLLDYAKLPPEERAVLKRATARDPAKRFPSATEFIRTLRDESEVGRQSMAGAVRDLILSKQTNVVDRLKPGFELVPGHKLGGLLHEGVN